MKRILYLFLHHDIQMCNINYFLKEGMVSLADVKKRECSSFTSATVDLRFSALCSMYCNAVM